MKDTHFFLFEKGPLEQQLQELQGSGGITGESAAQQVKNIFQGFFLIVGFFNCFKKQFQVLLLLLPRRGGRPGT